MRKQFLLTAIGLLTALMWATLAHSEEIIPTIARWYDNKEAAVSLRFDDNLESHVRTAIPLVNRFGIKATFMVNPGRSSFKHHKEFWTKEVPAMGHVLGNHTMNHKGARSLQEARYEIREAARIIRALYPDRSPLMVFASGGGEKWDGKDWENADRDFKDLVGQYDLIDLYDGKHLSFGARSGIKIEDFIAKLEQALEKRSHQPFSFHHIGRPRLKDRLRSLLGGYDLSFPEMQFEEFLRNLYTRTHQFWIAPLVDILKYELERDGARLTDYSRDKGEMKFNLEISTDPRIYDQPLTIILTSPGWEVLNITQNGNRLTLVEDQNNLLVFHIRPIPSSIIVKEN